MIDVTCAIIRNEEKKILIVQRGENTDHPFKWEFPGGKVTQGESEEDCIIREIREELSMEIVICRRLQPFEYDYGHKQIRLIPFVCDTLDELPLLAEHMDYRWIDMNDLLSADYSEADVPVAREYYETEGRQEEPHELIPDPEISESDDSSLRKLVSSVRGRNELEWITGSITGNPAMFKRLIDYSFSSEKELAFKASWTLTKVCDKAPEMIDPYLAMIVKSLDGIGNDSVRRSFLRIISFSDIEKTDSRLHGLLADHCFRALNSAFSPVAIKAYSMEILYRLAVKYPELANELSAAVNMLRDEDAGVKARGRIILKKLSKGG
jgi:8-oxo-dGTP diphosphatase